MLDSPLRSPERLPAATSLTLRAESDAPAAVGLGNRSVFVNRFTAEVYGEGTGNSMRAFFSTMVSWHRYLAMNGESRGTGWAITGASNLLFLCLVLSGLYLWWPKTLTRAQFRHITWFRSGLRPQGSCWSIPAWRCLCAASGRGAWGAGA